MSYELLPDETIRKLAAEIIQLVGYAPQTRAAMLGGLPATYIAVLPGMPPPPMVALLLDLQAMNGVRLANGMVPLKVVLQGALLLAGPVEGTAGVRGVLELLEGRTTGAPRVAADDLPEVKEKIVFQDDMVPFGFLEAGLAVARGVAKLSVPRFEQGVPRMNGPGPMIYLGTGWLMAPGLLLTNHHVINARNEGEPAAAEADLRKQAAGTVALFDYDHDGVAGTPTPVSELVAWDVVLDYALVRLDGGDRKPLSRAVARITDVKADSNVAVNIVQHPDGKPKRYAIRNNVVTASNDTVLRYYTDTLGGSSGSPVFNDRWEVVALHRGSTAVKAKFQGRDVAYVNVGTQITAVMADLQARFAGRLPELGI